MSNAQIQIPAPTTTFRDLVTNVPPVGIVPTFLNGPVGSRYMYSMAIIYDALIDAAGYAIRAGLPHYAPSDALTWIGQDRLIFQGPNEPTASYIARLVQWLDLWRHAGTSTALLLAMRGAVAPLLPEVVAVASSGDSKYSRWDTYLKNVNPFPAGQTDPTPPDGYVRTPLANWDWDGAVLPFYFPWMYWRKWVILFSPPGDPQSPFAVPTKTWASGGSLNVSVVADAQFGSLYENLSPASPGGTSFNWGDGTCWGWAGTAAQAGGLTTVITEWKSAGAWVPWILVSYDSTYFQQTNPPAVKNPDGTWGYWGVVSADATYGQVYQASRPACSTCTFIVGSQDGGGVLGQG